MAVKQDQDVNTVPIAYIQVIDIQWNSNYQNTTELLTEFLNPKTTLGLIVVKQGIIRDRGKILRSSTHLHRLLCSQKHHHPLRPLQ